jgi:hypothetical protein
MLKSFACATKSKKMILGECRMRGEEGNRRENLFDEFYLPFYTFFSYPAIEVLSLF